MPAASYMDGLTWLGHASFRFSRIGTTLYFDPWQIEGGLNDADLVFISHPHFDHMNAADLARVGKPDTHVVTVASVAAKLQEAGYRGAVRVVKPGEKLEVKGVLIEVVPAYNKNKRYHPQQEGWAGFIIELDGVRLYHAGDTDFIPEMEGLKVDVALLPVSGTYVMGPEEAAQAAKAINPKLAVPMHYGSIIGTDADARQFRQLCGSIIVEILEKQYRSP